MKKPREACTFWCFATIAGIRGLVFEGEGWVDAWDRVSFFIASMLQAPQPIRNMTPPEFAGWRERFRRAHLALRDYI